MIEIDTKILNFKQEICPGWGHTENFLTPGWGHSEKNLCPTPGEFTSARGMGTEKNQGSITAYTI